MKTLSEVRGLDVDTKIDDFSATDIFDNPYTFSNALKKGKVVLIFIRGQWCPFCNKHLVKIQKGLPKIYEKGASVVVISPEKSEFIKQTIEKTGAEFTILYDKDYAIAKTFDGLFLPNNTQRFIYNTVLGAKLKQSHSDDSEQLPVPATYIINEDFTIKWRHFNPNYINRSGVSEILNHL
ncbi:alkyl hydroperoxide reductase/ Thiol specific antioxidant/ Mal allergen (plasmid) [Emticicia oligotrophica DSM 17448]|uniref:Alkyl hydroperoxide reductase/ Thiol specific antioxidant/ Mal allergen n=1 Tax=Emticicia oligotrophica (strain DSM 17448 / CIP 109782 / MTCC 6937 / GPTSA100-15) TaxID=929562 RepID=A0ABM5N7Q9_EMTOG|nr:peroxiredoxin-like family protein [Emticicia oligotrophica]AFK05492.1 alkyl hydroperoxide reductase/ Thiol specific antioxidant/ Mal allergen [Emticicia oligotrophica DSM 17448]